MKKIFPLIEAMPYVDPVAIFSLIAARPWSIFLDSATVDVRLSRFSFIGFDPFLRVLVKDHNIIINDKIGGGNPWLLLKELTETYTLAKSVECPSPLQGGFMGCFNYDLCHFLEKVPYTIQNSLQFPDLHMGAYDVVLAFDHENKQAWIISTGFPEGNDKLRQQRARSRLELAKTLWDKPSHLPNLQLEHPIVKTVTPLTSKQSYLQKVQHVIDYIYAGDIYQANLSQRFIASLLDNQDPFTIYRRLRSINPAPFASYANYPDGILLSASPERFLKLTDQQITTAPIKGTRPRGNSPEADEEYIIELQQCEKDRAENIMIVDLLRNDLARVSQPGTVKVTKLCEIESYASVHHLVSTITSELPFSHNAIDVLGATFPGGSITGAPKIRAMEIINELEPEARGPFYGSMGYISFSGDMDTSILIRTLLLQDNQANFQVGGGIVADSIPEAEYEETLVKAKALMRTLLGVI